MNDGRSGGPRPRQSGVHNAEKIRVEKNRQHPHDDETEEKGEQHGVHGGEVHSCLRREGCERQHQDGDDAHRDENGEGVESRNDDGGEKAEEDGEAEDQGPLFYSRVHFFSTQRVLMR